MKGEMISPARFQVTSQPDSQEQGILEQPQNGTLRGFSEVVASEDAWPKRLQRSNETRQHQPRVSRPNTSDTLSPSPFREPSPFQHDVDYASTDLSYFHPKSSSRMTSAGQIREQQVADWDASVLVEHHPRLLLSPQKKFDRTMSHIFQDELYNPSIDKSAPPPLPQQYNTLKNQLSPQKNSILNDLLQAAQNGHVAARSASPSINDGSSHSVPNSPAQWSSAAQIRQQQKAESDALALADPHPTGGVSSSLNRYRIGSLRSASDQIPNFSSSSDLDEVHHSLVEIIEMNYSDNHSSDPIHFDRFWS
ncbi:MAG: hypothetical protein Q9181_006827 [Wetmoreana brouardii]